MKPLSERLQAVREHLKLRHEQQNAQARRKRRHQRKRTQAHKRKARRKQVHVDGMHLLKELVELDHAATTLIAAVEELGSCIERNHKLCSDLLEGSLPKRIRLMTTAFALSIGGICLDYYFLAGGTMFLLSLAGVTFFLAIAIGKVIVPTLVIFYELAAGVAEEEGRPRWVAYILPVVVAGLAATTYVAHVGITSLADITPMHVLMIVLLLGFGGVLHYNVVRLARKVFDGFTIVTDLYQRRMYNRLYREAEGARVATYKKTLEWIDSYAKHGRDYGVEVPPPYHLIPQAMRQHINEIAGHELIPRPGSVGGNGDSRTVA